MGIKSKAQIAKQEAKWSKEKKEIARGKEMKYRQSDEQTRLEYDIARLQSSIMNCDADLQGIFKGNETIIHKRAVLIETQTNLKNKLEVLKNGDNNLQLVQ